MGLIYYDDENENLVYVEDEETGMRWYVVDDSNFYNTLVEGELNGAQFYLNQETGVFTPVFIEEYYEELPEEEQFTSIVPHTGLHAPIVIDSDPPRGGPSAFPMDQYTTAPPSQPANAEEKRQKRRGCGCVTKTVFGLVGLCFLGSAGIAGLLTYRGAQKADEVRILVEDTAKQLDLIDDPNYHPVVDIRDLNITGIGSPDDENTNNPEHINGLFYLDNTGSERIIDFISPARLAVNNGYDTIILKYSVNGRDMDVELAIDEEGVTGSGIARLRGVIASMQQQSSTSFSPLAWHPGEFSPILDQPQTDEDRRAWRPATDLIAAAGRTASNYKG